MNKLVNLLNRVLNNNGVKLKKQDEYMYWSPFITHHKRKLQINTQTGKWHCWVSNVGGRNFFQLFKKVSATKEQFDELVELVGENKFYKVKEEDKKNIVKLPDDFKPLWNGNDGIVKRHALTYLYKRGITDVDIKKYKIGFCDSGLYEGRIIIPSYDDKGLLNYFVGRSFVGEKMKYKNPNVSRDIIPFDWYIAWSKPIVLCEGVFDAMSIRSNAIPMLSKKPSKSLLRKIFEKNVKTIYIALDDDAKKDAYNMSEFFRDFGIDCKVVKLPTDKDPNDLGWKKITTLIHSTESASFSDSIQARLYG